MVQWPGSVINVNSNSQFIVTLNWRPADIPFGGTLDEMGADHEWLTTNTGISVGMGPATGVPKSNAPLVNTYVVDHTGEIPTGSISFTGVDQTAFMTYATVGAPLGAWVPGVNDCNTWAANVIYESTPHDITVYSSSSIGAEYGGYFGGDSSITYHDVVVYADGSIHQPGGN